jgi:hypothetical protein
MRGSAHPFVVWNFFHRRWSTGTIVVVSLGVGALAYYWGRRHAPAEKISDATPLIARETNSFEIRVASTATPAPTLASGLDSPLILLEERWSLCSRELRTPAIDEQKIACLREMAEQDPRRAMELALAESDFRLREKLRDAVLHGWAAKFPDEAAAWALELALGEQRTALEAVFSGAASRPDEAIRLSRALADRDAARAGEFGQLVIGALTADGAYEAALRFAGTDETPNRAAWFNATFFQWASHQPEAALKALGEISDPAARTAAFQGMVSGWAATNPVSLADYAIRLSPGEDRGQAFSQMFPEWVNRDPFEASEWMLRHFTPSTDMDAGMAAAATLPKLIAERPEVAVGWAENIADPALRTETLRKIAREWSQRDADAVRRFATATRNLAAEERKAFLDGLASVK